MNQIVVMKRAETYDEIKPLIELCKTGNLFEVQAWIASGKPVNPPPPPAKKARKKCPLQVAVEKGFHSLVQILLEAGAIIQDGSFNAFAKALIDKRLDLLKLMVAHGADINSVEMIFVFDAWDPKIIEYFIEQGADVEPATRWRRRCAGKYELLWECLSVTKTGFLPFRTS